MKCRETNHWFSVEWTGSGLQLWMDASLIMDTSNFQAGVNTLYNKCVSCGVTPSSKTPTAISNSIQSIYNNRYNEGYSAGQNANKDWKLILKITFGAAANNGSFVYNNGDSAATDTPVGWYTSMQTTITCIDGQVTITGKCASAGRFSNQQNIAGYVSNISVVSFEYL